MRTKVITLKNRYGNRYETRYALVYDTEIDRFLKRFLKPSKIEIYKEEFDKINEVIMINRFAVKDGIDIMVFRNLAALEDYMFNYNKKRIKYVDYNIAQMEKALNYFLQSVKPFLNSRTQKK